MSESQSRLIFGGRVYSTYLERRDYSCAVGDAAARRPSRRCGRSSTARQS